MQVIEAQLSGQYSGREKDYLAGSTFPLLVSRLVAKQGIDGRGK